MRFSQSCSFRHYPKGHPSRLNSTAIVSQMLGVELVSNEKLDKKERKKNKGNKVMQGKGTIKERKRERERDRWLNQA